MTCLLKGNIMVLIHFEHHIIDFLKLKRFVKKCLNNFWDLKVGLDGTVVHNIFTLDIEMTQKMNLQ